MSGLKEICEIETACASEWGIDDNRICWGKLFQAELQEQLWERVAASSQRRNKHCKRCAAGLAGLSRLCRTSVAGVGRGKALAPVSSATLIIL